MSLFENDVDSFKKLKSLASKIFISDNLEKTIDDFKVKNEQITMSGIYN